MFRGRFEHTLDTKSRLSIPAKFREVLLGKGDDRIVISNFVYTDSRCLDVYPYDEWLRFEEQLKTKPKFERHMLLFQNYYLANASECSVDKQGRILIPPHLRSYAGLKKDIVMVGAVEKFRIWDKEAYRKVFVEAEEKLMQDPDFLNELGL